MLVAAQGPICARLSAGLRGGSLAAVFLTFLSATLVTGLLGACHVVISMQAISPSL